jgi:phosphoribosylanthranilate isomerase
MTFIKICGIRLAETLDYCSDLKVDYAGFTAYPPSPRHLDPVTFGQLVQRLANRTIQSVLVTVDADDAILDSYFSQGTPHFIQCHGKESPARVQELKERYGVGIIKAVPIAEAADLKDAEAYYEDASIILFDAKPARQTDLPGGNARSFDWQVLQNHAMPLPWFLSGGLTPRNVAGALRLTHAPGVDVSSGVEIARGIKDNAEIKAFVEQVREYDQT